ncbi:hypothetical protein Pfo_020242 [Paulownia fortunei]|nr:hypothetical protein Pfo_020242 [Paulownia fortunei]
MGNSSELAARRRMQNGAGAGGGGTAAAEEVNAWPTKRMRRPSVRLHQPYYENSGHRRLQQQWNAFKKDLEGARKPRTHKTVNVKSSKKSDGVSDSSNGEGMVDLKFGDDDDVAIGNENEKFALSSGGESEKQRERNEGEKENLDANGINMNFEAEDSGRHCSIGNGKLIDDDNNVVGNQGRMQRGLRSGGDLDDMEGEARTREGESGRDTDRDGVRVWLNQLGLGKYAPLFEVHEVDDEVLPFLTLEDLKNIGINAVGSRRKMYLSIQKLGKGFS